MWGFSKSVNEYLNEELLNSDNEEKFLLDFKNAEDRQVNLEESMIDKDRNSHVIEVWNKKIPIVFNVEKDEDDVLDLTNVEVDFTS